MRRRNGRVLSQRKRIEVRLQQRARIVLLAAKGMQNKDIAGFQFYTTGSRDALSLLDWRTGIRRSREGGDDAGRSLRTDDIPSRRSPTNRLWSRRLTLRFATVRAEMSQLIERRTRNLDPIDVLSPEVFAVLKLCGGTREGDRQATLDKLDQQTALERRRHARRGTDSPCSPT